MTKKQQPELLGRMFGDLFYAKARKQAAAEKPAPPEPRAWEYKRDAQWTEDRDPCAICGKPVDTTKPHWGVHVSTSGAFLEMGDDANPDSQGGFVVGEACAKRLPPEKKMRITPLGKLTL